MPTNPLTLRVQSADGTKRLNIDPKAKLRSLHSAIHELFDFSDNNFEVSQQRNFKTHISSSVSQTVVEAGLKHGDMLYVKHLDSGASTSGASTSAEIVSNGSLTGASNNKKLIEDDVDVQLQKVDGKIQRKRDDKLCRHNSHGCCVHCSPLEPWDENYLKEQKIKHLSFTSYLRKMTSGVDKGKFAALEDLNCKIRPGCREHPPWPKGICSKCQPSAITLNRQPYRHTDNVMFENPEIVERFLNYWRCTGHQRIGLLFGVYEVHNDVPLGIRARVAAIYEPPQESTRDYIKLLEDENEGLINEICSGLGLQKVGWIFTDLITDDPKSGTVKHVRGIKTHFLTAHECMMAAQFQNKYQNPCKYSSQGYFGSKFVTVCVTGDDKKQVHMEGYQVSAQCMALVRDDCFLPTRDAPELGYIRESTDKQYVPDVYYKEKDVYGNEVSRLARPLPIEYLLVDIPASTPLQPLYTFPIKPGKQTFPVENRFIDKHLQDFTSLSSYLLQFTTSEFLDALSDFHLLLFLGRMDVLPMRSHMPTILKAVRDRDLELATQFKRDEVWRTLEQLIATDNTTYRSDPFSSSDSAFAAFAGGVASTNTGSSSSMADVMGGAGNGGSASGASNGESWTCAHCTFINSNALGNCEMCSLPK